MNIKMIKTILYIIGVSFVILALGSIAFWFYVKTALGELDSGGNYLILIMLLLVGLLLLVGAHDLPIKKENIRKKIFKYAVLLLIVGIVLGAISYLQNISTQNSFLYNADQLIQQRKAKEAAETGNWKVYRDEKYGFELKYPGDWHFQTSLSNMGADVLLADPPSVSSSSHVDTDLPYLFRATLYSQLSQLDWKKLGTKDLNDFISKYSLGPDPYIINAERIIVGDNIGYKAEAGPNVFGGGNLYFFEHEQKVVEVQVFTAGQVFVNNIETINQILSSFKFY